MSLKRIQNVAESALEELFHALDAELDCDGETAGRIWAAAYHAAKAAIAREYGHDDPTGRLAFVGTQCNACGAYTYAPCNCIEEGAA